MIILTLRTDKPEAEIGLYENSVVLAHHIWTAHRQLAETVHSSIRKLLVSQKLDWSSVEGIVVYEGPGSFTGLRIGLTVANTIAQSYSLPIVGAKSDDWAQLGIDRLLHKENDKLVMPHYGAGVHITKPRT